MINRHKSQSEFEVFC